MNGRRMVIAIGSNLGDRLAVVRLAVHAIGKLPGVRLLDASSVYETPAITLNGVDDQVPRYLNAVATARSERDPVEVLTDLQRIEQRFGRRRTARWASRTLDLDLIDVDGIVMSTGRLTLPHPRAWERAFVLVPWHEIEPDASLPGRGSIADLAASAHDRVELFAASPLPSPRQTSTDRGLPVTDPQPGPVGGST